MPTSANRVVIIGAGGTGTDVASWIPERVLGFLDDAPEKQGTCIAGFPVLGPLRAACDWRQTRFVNTIGSPAHYRRRAGVLAACNIGPDRLESAIHPSAIVLRGAELGPGVVLYPQAVVCATARLGSQVVLLANVVVNHDVTIGNCTIVASGVTLAGRVRIGSNCYIGAGAHLIQDVEVGDGSIVGMGSVVLKDVPPGSVVAGNPARFLRSAT
jgi:sugar O-acyltransferase (sialic acid O-acetyltransferase NeuD family)